MHTEQFIRQTKMYIYEYNWVTIDFAQAELINTCNYVSISLGTMKICMDHCQNDCKFFGMFTSVYDHSFLIYRIIGTYFQGLK